MQATWPRLRKSTLECLRVQSELPRYSAVYYTPAKTICGRDEGGGYIAPLMGIG